LHKTTRPSNKNTFLSDIFLPGPILAKVSSVKLTQIK